VHGTIESGLSVEVRPLGELAAFADDLRRLSERALVPNVFYEPAFLAAAAPVFGIKVSAGLVWRRGTPKHLVGFFPVSIQNRRYGLKIPVLVGFTHSFGPLGTPLIDREHGETAVAAWLDHIAGHPELPKLLLMPFFTAESDVARAFNAALTQRGGRSAEFALHRRALLAPPQDDRTAYLEQRMPHKKRKELRRLRKRLADRGALDTSTVTGNAAKSALADFFALEAAGWKGRAGTAAKRDDAICNFVSDAVGALADEGKASVTRLMFDGRAIAAIVTLRCGDTAWCWKTTYNESFARYSPGMQCLLDVTEALLADPRVTCADSCATPNHPMIDHVWRERVALADRLMCVVRCDQTLFEHACKMESVRRSTMNGLKYLRGLFRRI
jgi:CelD/BcsL family acetyltransferase involved in cellulose biosynthesis